MNYWYLFSTLAFLHTCDAISTKLCLQFPGTQELNKLVVFLQKKVGLIPGLLLLKGSHLLLLWGIYSSGLLSLCWNIVLVSLSVTIIGLAVVNNIFVLKKLSAIED
jgi:hypothetical protein